MPEGAPKPSLWKKMFGRKEAKSPVSAPNQLDSNSPANRPEQIIKYIEAGGTPELDKEKIISIAEEIIATGLESSHLKPTEKNNSIKEYLEKEFSIGFKTGVDLPKNCDEIDKLIAIKGQDIVSRQFKKWGKKTLISGAFSMLSGGALAIFTGGASVGLSVFGFLGGTAGRGITETVKGIMDVYGKGGALRKNIAKAYLAHYNEALKAAQDLLTDEDAPDQSKFWQASKKLIDTVYQNQFKEIEKAKKELADYEQKWNTAAEWVATAGSIAAGALQGFMSGSEKFAQQQISKAAETQFAGVAEKVAEQGAQINLDNNDLHHAVKFINGQWHQIFKPEDIQFAAEHGWRLTQLGDTAAEVGATHIKALDTGSVLKALRPHIEQFISNQAQQEWMWRVIPSVIVSYSFNNAMAWGAEKVSIARQFGVKSNFLNDRKALQERYGKKIEEEIKKIQGKKDIKEINLFTNINKYLNKVFLFDTGDGQKPRIKFVKIDDNDPKNPKFEFDFDEKDKKSDGSAYKPGDYKFEYSTPEQIKAFHQKLTPWEDKKEYSFREWQEVTEALRKKDKEIKELEANYKGKDKQLIFIDDNKKTELGLEANSEYKVQEIYKDRNIAVLYKASQDYNETNKSEINLNKLIDGIKLSKDTITETMEQLFNEFNKEKDKRKKIKFRTNPKTEFLTDGSTTLETNKQYQVTKIDKDQGIINLTQIDDGTTIKFKNYRGLAQAIEKLEVIT